MRAPENLVRPLARTERWIFGPGSARRLAAVRIGLCLALAGRLSRPLYVQVAGQPRALYRPISFMHLFSSMPSASVVRPVQAAAVAASLLAAAGAAVRLTIPIALLGGLFLNGMWASVGQPMHNETLLLLAMVPLLFARCADAWSLHSLRRGRITPDTSPHYGWPVRAGMVVVAGGYFFTGIYKLLASGPAWFTTDNVRWVLYGISAEHRHAIGPAIFLACEDSGWVNAHVLYAEGGYTSAAVTEDRFRPKVD